MISKNFPIADKLNLRCRYSSGSLTVQARDGLTEASVRLSARNGDDRILEHFRVELAGDTLDIHEDRDRRGSMFENLFGRNRGGVDVEVMVPSGSGLSVHVQSADIRTTGRVGDSDIASGSSQIELDEVDGDLRVRGGSGDLRISRVTGAGHIRGGSGQISIGDAGKEVNVGMGSGSLSIGAAHGSVRMRSGSGGAVIGVAEADVDVTSGSGQVTIGLLPGQPAKLDVLTGSGRLHTDMPVESQASTSATGKPITVRARTGAGDVTIRRAG